MYLNVEDEKGTMGPIIFLKKSPDSNCQHSAVFVSKFYLHINAFGTKFLKKLQQANLLFPIRLFML